MKKYEKYFLINEKYFSKEQQNLMKNVYNYLKINQ